MRRVEGKRKSNNSRKRKNAARVRTTNPFARSKYVKGQIVYQKDPNAAAYYARPFAYRDGVLSVPADARLEEAVPTVLPPDRIKLNLVDL